MLDQSSPKSVNELVQFIVGYVTDECSRSGRAVNGPRLAQAIRYRYPGLSYSQLGLTRLADVVKVAQREGLLRRNRAVSHLEVMPGIASPVTGEPSESQARYVRPEIFKAFLFFQRNVHQYLDRTTGLVAEFSPDSATSETSPDSTRYVKIDMIPTAIQQGWMKEYLQTAGSMDVAEAPIETDRWWVEFPQWLRNKHPELEPGWRVYRIQSVISYARDWAQQNNVPITAVLTAESPHVRASTTVSFNSQAPKKSSNYDSQHSIAMDTGHFPREAILRAIAEMSDDELSSLAIPIRYIARHFRAI